jgi:antitoxin VapB
MTSRTVKIFRNGRNQAIRIPQEFAFPGDEAVLRQEGGRLVLEPVAHKSLLGFLANLPLEEGLPLPDDQPPEPFDL